MTDMWSVYAENIHDNFKNLYANWPPNVPLQLGDFGTLHRNVFTRKGNIKDIFQVGFKERSGRTDASEYSYKSSNSTELAFKSKAGGTAEGVTANASLEIKFSNSNSVLFQASGCSHDSVEDEVALGKEILKASESHRWDNDWVLITRAVRAGATTVVISASSNSSMVLEADAKVPKIDLADASLKLTVSSEKNIGFSVITKTSLTPLIGFSKVFASFWPWDNDHWGPASLAPNLAAWDSRALQKKAKESTEHSYSDLFRFGRIS